MNTTTITALTLTALTIPSFAALSWTGGTGGAGQPDGVSLYAENNWTDDTGAQPGANTINPGNPVTADTSSVSGDNRIDIVSGTGTPSNYGGSTGTFVVGNGNSLRVGGDKTLASAGRAGLTGGGSGTTLEALNTATISVGEVGGFDNYSFASGTTLDFTTLNLSGGTINSSSSSFSVASLNISTASSPSGNISSMTVTSSFDVTGNTLDNLVFTNLILDGATGNSGGGLATGSTFNLINGATLSSQFLNDGLTVNVDATSELTLRGNDTPIPGATINLSNGGTLSFQTQSPSTLNPGSIFNASAGVAYSTTDASNSDYFTWTGTQANPLTITAVPEPSSTALLGLAGLGLLMRRRR